jgi:hypothetical protein
MFKILIAVAAMLAAQPSQPGEADATERMNALLDAGTTEGAVFEETAADILAAAQAGDPGAMNLQGALLRFGLVDGDSAAVWFERAMAAGDARAAGEARLNLAMERYESGDPQAARAALETEDPLPDELEAERLAFLGQDILFGLGGPADPEFGQSLINDALIRGYEEPGILEAAGRYWSEAGEDGELRNGERALRMLRDAARFGSPSAAWRYAMVVLSTGGDPGEAWRYVAWASDQGLPSAMISRAVMLATGQGVEPDPEQARTWYARAAAQGSAHGARGLGAMLVMAEGGPAEPARGYALLELAAAGGDSYAAQLLAQTPDGAAPRPGGSAVADAKTAWLTETGLSELDLE